PPRKGRPRGSRSSAPPPAGRSFEVFLELLSYCRASPMQPDPLVGGRYAEERAHLGRVKPSHVAQQDDLPLLRRQGIDGGSHVLERFVAEHLRLRNVFPAVRPVPPHSVGTEARPIDRRPVTVRIVPAKER